MTLPTPVVAQARAMATSHPRKSQQPPRSTLTIPNPARLPLLVCAIGLLSTRRHTFQHKETPNSTRLTGSPQELSLPTAQSSAITKKSAQTLSKISWKSFLSKSPQPSHSPDLVSKLKTNQTAKAKCQNQTPSSQLPNHRMGSPWLASCLPRSISMKMETPSTASKNNRTSLRFPSIQILKRLAPSKDSPA